MKRDEIVAAARAWVGTPYVHQARTKGAGTDCLGLILGLWSELYGYLPGVIPPYTRDWDEAGQTERLWSAARDHLRPATEPRTGQVLLFRMRRGAVAKHLGVQTVTGSEARFVHAYSGHGVIENALSRPWARRVVARFEFPGVTD